MIKEIDSSLVSDVFGVSASLESSCYLGYFLDESLVGYLEYVILYERAELCQIFVLEEFRNRKIGFILMNSLVDICKKFSCYNITLEVNVNNTFAIALYERVGFVKRTLRKGYYRGVDGFLMELIL